MFTAYELAGVFTNLAAGMMGEERVKGRCTYTTPAYLPTHYDIPHVQVQDGA